MRIILLLKALTVRYGKGFGWLDGEARIVLEVDSGPEFPRKLGGAVDFEDVSGVEIEEVIFPIDVVIRIVEIVAGGLIGKTAAKNAFLPLPGEAAQDLPLVGQNA